MNWDIVKGNAKQLQGMLKQKWAKLTDDDLQLVSGKSEVFLGRLQERLGIRRDEIELTLDSMLKQLGKPTHTHTRPH